MTKRTEPNLIARSRKSEAECLGDGTHLRRRRRCTGPVRINHLQSVQRASVQQNVVQSRVQTTSTQALQEVVQHVRTLPTLTSHHVTVRETVSQTTCTIIHLPQGICFGRLFVMMFVTMETLRENGYSVTKLSQ